MENLTKLKAAFWPICCGILGALLIIVILPSIVNTQNYNASNKVQIDEPYSYANAVAISAPAVVNIFTRQTIVQYNNSPFYPSKNSATRPLQTFPQAQKYTTSGLGSGVIMNREGFILTNYHVIKDADEILVQLQDKRRSRAEIIGLDPETDLAVLKITLEDLPTIKEISNNATVGDIAMAIGNPLGIGQTVTMGIISATGRSNLGLNTYENFIQTDAAINRGNSGGALIDAKGRLIGINSVIFSKSGGSDGIGLTIPASLALQVLEDIIENGRVIRGWLGADFQKLTVELANYLNTDKNHGVVIVKVLNNGPAFQGNLQVGDLVLKINDTTIIQENDALAAIAKIKPGENARLTIIRQKQKMTLDIKVGERPLLLR